MKDPVVVDHDAEIVRRGWPTDGEIHIEDGMTRYVSRSGAEWGFIGFKGGDPLWLLFDQPFRTVEVERNDGAYVVTIPTQEAA